jgi:hypothetical protein
MIAKGLKLLCSICIVFLLMQMDLSINLNDQFVAWAIKIYDESTHWVLATKSKPQKGFAPDCIP